jgi:hypothetical protein
MNKLRKRGRAQYQISGSSRPNLQAAKKGNPESPLRPTARAAGHIPTTSPLAVLEKKPTPPDCKYLFLKLSLSIRLSRTPKSMPYHRDDPKKMAVYKDLSSTGLWTGYTVDSCQRHHDT